MDIIISDLNGEDIFERFYGKSYKRKINKSLWLKKQLREKTVNSLSYKRVLVHSIAGLKVKQVKVKSRMHSS